MTATNGTVLIVDDQEQNIQVAGSTLVAFQYEIMVATSGEQALERVDARSPDLILLDILMPEMDGFEVCAALKAKPEARDVPIIFLSANDDKNIIVRALESGGVDYITKPFNKAELIARVRTHIELKQARDQLDDLVRKREEFIALMAHDLKNPLSGVQFSASLLGEMQQELPEKAGKLAKSIGDATESAIEQIQTFLQEFQDSHTDFEVKISYIDVSPLIEKVIETFQTDAARKNIDLIWEKPDEPFIASADAFAVERILDNLLSNALKFSKPGAEVTILTDPGAGKIRIKDQGPGLTDADREKLFEQFTRLSATPTGGETSTGLGLSIAKRLAEKMNAQLEAEDNPPDGGACFSLTLAKEQ